MIEAPRRTADALSHLVFFGLVGAVTVILFSVASVSLLTTDKKPPLTGSGNGDAVFRHINGNAGLIPAPAYSPALDPMTVPMRLPSQAASGSETAEATGARSGPELPSAEYDASTTTLELQGTAPIQDSQITKPKSAEVGGSDQASTEPLPEAEKLTREAPEELSSHRRRRAKVLKQATNHTTIRNSIRASPLS
jgi:hypothetical protein